MTEIEYLKEQLEKAVKFISQIENDCYPLIDEIIDTVCKNVIKRINTESKQINLCDDLPKDSHSSTNYQFCINPEIMTKYSFQMGVWKITLVAQ